MRPHDDEHDARRRLDERVVLDGATLPQKVDRGATAINHFTRNVWDWVAQHAAKATQAIHDLGGVHRSLRQWHDLGSNFHGCFARFRDFDRPWPTFARRALTFIAELTDQVHVKVVLGQETQKLVLDRA